MAMAQPRCPECASSETVKVSLAYERDATHTHATFGGKVGRSGFGGGLSAAKQTKLGMRLRPPQRAGLTPGLLWTLVGTIIFFLASLGNAINEDKTLRQRIAAVVVFFVLSTICLAFFLLGKAKIDAWNQDEYPLLMENWKASWLCEKCGSVFNPTRKGG